VGLKYGKVPRDIHKVLVKTSSLIKDLRKEHGEQKLTVAGSPKTLNDIALLTIKRPKEALEFFETCEKLQTEHPQLRCQGNWNPGQPGYVIDEVADGSTKEKLQLLMSMFYKNKEQRESESCKSPGDKAKGNGKGKKSKKTRPPSPDKDKVPESSPENFKAEEMLEKLSEAGSTRSSKM
jgi:hypothetical protein